jgi:hypothetical protein
VSSGKRMNWVEEREDISVGKSNVCEPHQQVKRAYTQTPNKQILQAKPASSALHVQKLTVFPINMQPIYKPITAIYPHTTKTENAHPGKPPTQPRPFPFPLPSASEPARARAEGL